MVSRLSSATKSLFWTIRSSRWRINSPNKRNTKEAAAALTYRACRGLTFGRSARASGDHRRTADGRLSPTTKVVPESHQWAKRRVNAVPDKPIGCQPQYHHSLGMLAQHSESTPRCYARLPGVWRSPDAGHNLSGYPDRGHQWISASDCHLPRVPHAVVGSLQSPCLGFRRGNYRTRGGSQHQKKKNKKNPPVS